jgi:coenzyme F420-reducing hydrogenase alpha subunit
MNRIEMSFRAYVPCMSCATHGCRAARLCG